MSLSQPEPQGQGFQILVLFNGFPDWIASD